MSSPNAFLESDQLVLPLTCANCGQQGTAVVERASYRAGNPPEYVFVSLPDDFYQRLAKPDLRHIEIACLHCKGVVPAIAYESEYEALNGKTTMLSSRNYLRRAAECEAEAAKTDNPPARQLWIVVAGTWRKMATSRALAAQAEQTKTYNKEIQHDIGYQSNRPC